MTPTAPHSFLAGLTDEQREILGRWPRRRFPPGTVMIERGQLGAGVYVVLEGVAEVLASSPSGELRRLATVGEGDLLGELALFSGQPASSEVRAVTEVEALALDGDRALDAATELPWLYPALGSVVADRLVRTQRQLLQAETGRTIVLHDDGAPPLLSLALGASVAWHTRRPALLVLCGVECDHPSVRDAADADELVTIAAQVGPDPVCHVVRVPPRLAPDVLAAALARSSALVPEVLLCRRADAPPVRADVEARITSPGPAARSRAEDPLTVVGWASASSPDVVAVSEPHGQELTDLGTGTLGVTGVTGTQVGRAARALTRQRVGVAFGSGSARGFAHIGVLRAFARHGIPIDAVAGTSIGAAVAALHAGGDTPEQIFATLTEAGRLAVSRLGTGRSLLSITGLRRLIEGCARGRRIEELSIPLAVVAADLDTGEEVVFRRGALAPAVLASLAIPGVYPPQHVADRRLIDGAYVDPVPVSAIASLGVDKIVAVRLAARPPTARVEPESVVTRGEALWAPQVILRSIDVMSAAIAGTGATAADALIEPVFHGLGGSLRDFRRGRDYERIGEQATEAALPALADALPWIDARLHAQ